LENTVPRLAETTADFNIHFEYLPVPARLQLFMPGGTQLEEKEIRVPAHTIRNTVNTSPLHKHNLGT
jgi:hypothetical protein